MISLTEQSQKVNEKKAMAEKAKIEL